MTSETGLAYKKCVLHVHTPASSDFKPLGGPFPTPRQFLEAALAKGIDVLGICDHHSFDWIKPLRDARDEIFQETGREITIFPGIELHTPDSVHVLALFDPEILIDNLETFLGAVEVAKNDRGKGDYQLKKHGLERGELLKLIHEYHGLSILAHAHLDGKGFFKACRGHAIKNEIMEKGGVIYEVASSKVLEVMKTCKNTACFCLSDVHDIGDFLRDDIAFWIQMAPKPNLLSLKQVLFEPNRISFQAPRSPDYPRITRLMTNTKYFGNLDIAFNDELNVFIGGRGTGKSLIIEIITFILCKYPVTDPDLKKNYLDKLNTHLIDGEMCTIYVSKGDARYRISRVFSLFNFKKDYIQNLKSYDENNPPSLEKFETSLGEWREELSETWEQEIDPDIYTQKCVPDIAQRIDLLLDIIDAQSSALDSRITLNSDKEKAELFNREINETESKLVEKYASLQNPVDVETDITTTEGQINELVSTLDNPERKTAIKWTEQNLKIVTFFTGTESVIKKLPSLDGAINDIPVLEKVDGFSEFDFTRTDFFQADISEKLTSIKAEIDSFSTTQVSNKKVLENEWVAAYRCCRVSPEGQRWNTEIPLISDWINPRIKPDDVTKN